MNGAFGEVEILWAEHRKVPFPSLQDGDLFGDLVVADMGIAGIVDSYVKQQGGPISPHRRSRLSSSVHDVRAIRRRIRTVEGRAYVDRLLRMADLLLGSASPEDGHGR
ncbi:hypothetical protein [Nonomuraea guangzhouensis]|uniref:Uncharacterized protein n=1 Tax=Nonomuraea guangzhouensis TaxID=1291555 RepID=A0ABW4GQ36_9ACTN|nr:hypothetical protein [Nonomuraea guangzhouensis]